MKEKIVVVGGAGHVGLPLSLVFAAAGAQVSVMDVSEKSLKTLREKKIPFMEKGGEELLGQCLDDGSVTFTDQLSSVTEANTVVVTIGTPVDEFLNPMKRVVKQCLDGIMDCLSDNQLIVLRSTLYPGTTEWLGRYLKERGKGCMVAFCPERVVQGYAIEEIRSFPQIVSGLTPEAEERAAALFLKISPSVVRLPALEAEFAKLFSNAYRYITFAASNQFYMIADSAGVDYGRVVEALRHDYPRAHHLPKAGFAAGPCLFKDTMQLAAFSSNEFSLGHAAMLVNEGLVLYLVDKMEEQHDLSKLTVGLLGMAFKADNDDTRSSLSYKMKKLLELKARRVLTTDPFVKTDPNLTSLEATLEESDILVLCAPHSLYRDIKLPNKPLIDIWGHLHKPSIQVEYPAAS